MSRYAAVIFDFDYTLGDCTDAIVESFAYAFTGMGLDAPERDDVRRTVGMTLPDSFKQLSGETDDARADTFVRLFKVKADEVMARSARFYPDALPSLAALRAAGIKTGIVTTKYRFRIDNILAYQGADDAFDVIVGGDEVGAAKPDPEGLRAAIAQLGVDKAAVLYVGDSMIDARTAENAGVDFAAVTTGTTTEDDFGKCAHVLCVKCIAEVAAHALTE